MNIQVAIRREIVQRARGRCEYCGLSQIGQEAQFHIDHVRPMASGGKSVAENLALACVSCSLRKGARRKAADPLSGKLTSLFDPRKQSWNDHFQWKGCRVIGRTNIARTTVEALKMNRSLAQAIRTEEALRDRHPPPHRN